MPKIFISYRRADSQITTERIHDKLSQMFGSDNVFLDVADDIPPGTHWHSVLDENLKKSDTLLVIIGKEWERIMIERANDTDFVRYEVEYGIQQANQMQVIPILVHQAVVPTVLPPTVQALNAYQFTQVRGNPDFHHDMERLIKLIRKRKARSPLMMMLVTVLILALLGLAGLASVFNRPSTIIETLTPTLNRAILATQAPRLTDTPLPIVLGALLYTTDFDSRSGRGDWQASERLRTTLASDAGISYVRVQNTSSSAWETFTLLDFNQADYMLDLRLRAISEPTDAGAFGLVSRYENRTGNALMAFIDVNQNKLGISEVQNFGDVTILDEVSFSIGLNTWHSMRFQLQAGEAHLWLNEILVAVTQTNYTTAGVFHIVIPPSSTLDIDTVSIYQNP